MARTNMQIVGDGILDDAAAEYLSENLKKWKVTAYTGKNRNVLLGATYVHADSESQAIDLGKRAFRLIGIRGALRVSASRYDPLRDLVSGSHSSGFGKMRIELRSQQPRIDEPDIDESDYQRHGVVKFVKDDTLKDKSK